MFALYLTFASPVGEVELFVRELPNCDNAEEIAEEEYLTFNPGVIVGGTDTNYDPVNARGSAFGKTNVVSQAVTVHGGIRTISIKQLDEAIKSMKKIVSNNLPGTTATIEFKTSYPPMEPTKANYALLDKLEEVNIALGYGKLEPLDPSKRGAADISFIAPYVEDEFLDR